MLPPFKYPDLFYPGSRQLAIRLRWKKTIEREVDVDVDIEIQAGLEEEEEEEKVVVVVVLVEVMK